MSKKRLGFDAEREMKHLKEIVNKDDSITLSSRFVKYLIEQAERVQELEEEIGTVKFIARQNNDYGIKMRGKSQEYREALEFLNEVASQDLRTSVGVDSHLVIDVTSEALEGDD